MAATNTVVDERRSEVEKVLRSEMFLRAPSLSHLLSYISEKTLSGEGQSIKEYSIAVDVFGRDPSFDHESDSIVRVQANRLRKHLAQYYEGEGAHDPVQVSIPVGQYIPLFEHKRAAMEPKPVSPVRKHNARTWAIVVLAGALVVVGAVLLVLVGRKQEAYVRPEPSLPPAIDGPVGPPVGEEVRILAGADREYVDRAGKRWGTDKEFSGGMAVHNAIQHVWRTSDPEIYRHSRQGEFAYDIPLKAGRYELRLHFAESEYGPETHVGGGEGSRLMAVTANGKPLLTDFDVVSDANGSLTADVKVFTDITPANDGKLHLKFSSVHGGRGMVSAIEILPGLQGKMRPVRVVTRDSAYYSDESRWWSPDNYYMGGQTALRVDSATATDDAELYESERWGHFSYSIPVTPGRYTAVLHFVERRFGAVNNVHFVGPPITKPGATRVFNVFCNGKLVLKELEIVKESRDGKPLAKKITGLEPNVQGKLNFEFVPVSDYATVSAIEILPE